MMREEGARNNKEQLLIATVTKDYPKTELKLKGIKILTKQIKYSSWAKHLFDGWGLINEQTTPCKKQGAPLKKDDLVLCAPIYTEEDINGKKIAVLESVIIIDRVVE